MEAKAINKKTYMLTDEGQQLGELHYKSLFSYNAEIKLTNAETYEIKSVGFFKGSLSVRKNGSEIAKIKSNWKGQIVFTFPDGQDYIFKAKGVFSNKYTFEKKDGENLILIIPKFDWRKFNYRYNISFEHSHQDILHVLLCVFASNYMNTYMSSIILLTTTSGIIAGT